MGPEIGQLSQRMGKPVSGTFHQVVTLMPGQRRVIDFEFQMCLKISNSQQCQALEYCLPRLITDVIPILITRFIQVAYRDNGNQGILSWRGCRRVKPCRGMDVKAGIVGQRQALDDGFEVLPVIVGQE